MRWAGLVTGMGQERKVYKVLERRPEEKRPLGRQRMGSDGSYGYGLGGGCGVDSVDWWQALVSLVMDPGVLAPRSYLVHFADNQSVLACIDIPFIFFNSNVT
jgi:hypothetical protein